MQHDAAERDPVPAPVGDGTDGRKQDATADERTVGEEPGSGQGEKPDGVGAAHEQPESAGGGNDPDRADLQLSFLEAAIPTEAQQIESIDQAESEKSSSAFVLSQADIEKALRRGSNFENSKLRIWEIYQTQPDRKLRAKALAKEYAPHGPGGCSHTYLDGSSGWLDHDSKGLTFEHYPDHQKIFLRWNQVEKYAQSVQALGKGGSIHVEHDACHVFVECALHVDGRTVSVPLLNEKQLVARSTAEAAGKRCDPYRDAETDRVPQKEQKNSRRCLRISGRQRWRMGRAAV